MKRKADKAFRHPILVVVLTCLCSTTLLAVGQKEKPDETQPNGVTKESQEGKAGAQKGMAGSLELRDSIELKDAVLRAEDLMQRARFREADAVLVRGPIPRDKKMYAGWLRALALYQIPDYPQALKICLASMREPGPWQHKIRFLAAEIYLRQKQFREAEEIYEQESRRLLSKQRKEDVAGVYVRFAESLSYTPEPEELDLPEPDFDEAYSFYSKALDLEIGPELGAEIRFRMARMRELDEYYDDAAQEYRSYLRDFDPEWRREGYRPDGKSVSYRGGHRAEARYRLAESLINSGDYRMARIELEDLLSLLEAADGSPAERSVSGESEISANQVTAGSQTDDMDTPMENQTWRRLAMRRIPFTYGFPHPGSDTDLEAGLTATDTFLSRYPEDPIAGPKKARQISS